MIFFWAISFEQLITKALVSRTLKCRLYDMSSRKYSGNIDVFSVNKLESIDTLMAFTTTQKIY